MYPSCNCQPQTVDVGAGAPIGPEDILCRPFTSLADHIAKHEGKDNAADLGDSDAVQAPGSAVDGMQIDAKSERHTQSMSA